MCVIMQDCPDEQVIRSVSSALTDMAESLQEVIGEYFLSVSLTLSSKQAATCNLMGHCHVSCMSLAHNQGHWRTIKSIRLEELCNQQPAWCADAFSVISSSDSDRTDNQDEIRALKDMIEPLVAMLRNPNQMARFIASECTESGIDADLITAVSGIRGLQDTAQMVAQLGPRICRDKRNEMQALFKCAPACVHCNLWPCQQLVLSAAGAMG